MADERVSEDSGHGVPVTGLRAAGFPEQAVRARARSGAACAFPPLATYGCHVFGAERTDPAWPAGDRLEVMRLVPPVFMPCRFDKLLELGREPVHSDVDRA